MRESSFRDLPTAPELPDDQPTATPEEISELVAMLEARLVHFETPSWEGIANEIKAQMVADQARLGGIGSYTDEQIRELRGRVQALSWILNLPEQIRMDLKQQFDLLHEIAQQPTDEGDESDG